MYGDVTADDPLPTIEAEGELKNTAPLGVPDSIVIV